MRLFVLLVIIVFVTPVVVTAASPPSSTISVSDQSQLGQEGWYVSSVQFTIQSTDDTGIKIISYQIDTGSVTDVAVTPPSAGASTSFSYGASGAHTVRYWATDIDGNIETTKSLSFKVDVNAPGNWREFTTTRQGNEHTFVVSARVSDVGSGLKVNTAQVQYTVDDGSHWGYYQNPTNCGSTWVEGGFLSATTDPATDGVLDAKLITQAIDFCNSNWAIDKKVRFKIRDVAGNESTKVFTINGGWMKTIGGSVHAQNAISMAATGKDQNATGLVTSGSTIDNFTTSGASITGYPAILPPRYQEWKNILSPKASIPNGKLPQSDTTGVYIVNETFTIDNVTKPSGTAQFVAIVFVEDDLILKQSYTMHPKSVLIFFVEGDVLIDKGVETIAGIFYADDDIDTAYNGDANKTLVVTGAFMGMDTIDMTTRSLSGSSNTTTPSEDIRLPYSLPVNKDLLAYLGGEGNYRWEEIAP